MVLIQSTNPHKNLGKLDPIAIGKKFSRFIKGDRKIYISGKNQIKILCDLLEDANSLLSSTKLSNMELASYIPQSLLFRKGNINVQKTHSVTEIINNLDKENYSILALAVRRRQRGSNSVLDSIELRFKSDSIPKTVFIHSVAHHVYPVIPQPKRCHNCQLFGHISAQCKSSRAICEFCGGFHESTNCDDQSSSNYCFNCAGDYKSSSSTCPVYKYEYLVMKERYIHNLPRNEAIFNLQQRGIQMLRPDDVVTEAPEISEGLDPSDHSSSSKKDSHTPDQASLVNPNDLRQNESHKITSDTISIPSSNISHESTPSNPISDIDMDTTPIIESTNQLHIGSKNSTTPKPTTHS